MELKWLRNLYLIQFNKNQGNHLKTKIVTDKNERSKKQEKKLKNCKFPDCKKQFLGRGKTKYCDEHRKQKYKKILYQRPISNGVGEANIIIKHKYKKAVLISRICELDGCDCEYEITIIPNQIIYPKYCSKHRNKFKREFFTNNRNKKNEI